MVGSGVITTVPRKRDSHSLGMLKIAMIPSAPAIGEARSLKVEDEFSNFSRYQDWSVTEIFLQVAERFRLFRKEAISWARQPQILA